MGEKARENRRNPIHVLKKYALERGMEYGTKRQRQNRYHITSFSKTSSRPDPFLAPVRCNNQLASSNYNNVRPTGPSEAERKIQKKIITVGTSREEGLSDRRCTWFEFVDNAKFIHPPLGRKSLEPVSYGYEDASKNERVWGRPWCQPILERSWPFIFEHSCVTSLKVNH